MHSSRPIFDESIYNSTIYDEYASQSKVEPDLVTENSSSDKSPDRTKSDSLRQVLWDRVEAVNQYLPETGKTRSGIDVDYDSPTVTFRCAVLRGGKFKSGDKITLRVLEDVNDGVFTVKKHDLIEGYCSIEDRVQIVVHRVGGKPATLYGYDLDGMKGLWFTDSSSETIGSLSENLITEGSSLLSSRVGRIARGITSAGTESIQRKTRSYSVDIPSGHEILLGLIK